MVETKDRVKVDAEEWRATVKTWPQDDQEPRTLLERTYPTKAAAARWIRRQLNSLRGSGAYGAIDGVRYEASEFEDEEYGTVLDADAIDIASAYVYESTAGPIRIDWEDA